VTNWAYLEGTIDRAIWTLLQVNTIEGRIITTHASLPSRLNMLEAAARVRFTSLREESTTARRLAKRIRRMSSRRNRLIHGSWSVSADEPGLKFVHTFTARGRVTPTIEEATVPQIERFAAVIENITDDLDGFEADCRTAIPTLPSPLEMLRELEDALIRQCPSGQDRQ